MGVSKQALRSRIKSVNSTRKITKAMEMIANAKLFRMRNKMESNRVYAKKLEETVKDIVQNSQELDNPLLVSNGVEKKLVVVFCSDLGLCGGYNQNVLKKVKEIVNQNDDVYLVGTSLYSSLREEYNLLNQAPVQTDSISFQELKEIIESGIRRYINKEIGAVELVYTRFVNTMTFEAEVDTLLPFKVSTETKEEKEHIETLFEPSPEAILDHLVPMMISNAAYSDWMESGVSEQGSRRMAMKTATDNADELSEELLLEYNKARQAAITQEITEIVGGSSAV